MSFRKDRQKGFTLIELLIAMFIMSLVTGALYNIYVQNSRTWTCQNLITDVQQTARMAMDSITRDLTMAGYDIKTEGGSKAIDAAEANRVSFQYRDSDDNDRRYTYSFDAANKKLTRQSENWVSGGYSSTVPAIGSGNTIAENVIAFSLSYFDASGAVTTSTDDIKLIKVSIEVQSSATCPLDDQNRSMRLTSEVRPRNMGIGSASTDTTDPSCPADLEVIDHHVCGELDLTWTANSSLEGVSGYRAYYGVASGVYTDKADAGSGTSTTLTGLANGSDYYVKLVAYDDSGNDSPLVDCTEVIQSVAADAPGIPVGLDATASNTAAGASVTLSWTANPTQYPTYALHSSSGYGPDTDVSKYELWRKKHSDATWADATVIDVSGATSGGYTDTLDEKDKCTTFDYKIKAVTSCDATTYESPFTDIIYGDGAGTDINPDMPASGVTNTRPSDNTPPSDPTGTGAGGTVLSKAGYRRTFMNWNNPAEADLDSISIRYNKSDSVVPPYPASTADADGTGAENGSSGLFDADAEATGQAYTHLGSSDLFCTTVQSVPCPTCSVTAPACLRDGYTYSYSLFAIDSCGNESAGAETAQTTIGQCGEDTTGPTAGAPSSPQNFTVEACSTYSFKWDRIDDTYPTAEYDLAGFYLYRSDDGGTSYSKTTTNLIINPPAGQVSRSEYGTKPDQNTAYEGNIYKFKAFSIDCIRETQYGADPEADTGVAPVGTASSILTVTPGRLTFANNTGVILTGDLVDPTGTPAYGSLAKAFYHNSVKLDIENTSYGPVKWESADISWTNGSAYIKAIYRTDVSPEIEVWSSATPLASGSTVTLSDFRVDGSAGGLNTIVPLRFVFTDADDNAGISQDMRQNSISFANIKYAKVFYSDASELPVSCTDITVTESVTIPLNPRIEGTIQDKPSNPTYAWSVPGSSGTDIAGQVSVGASSTVNVYSNVFLDAGATLSSLKLYYAVTDKTELAAPTDPTDYTEREMFQQSGILYSLYTGSGTDNRIPANNDQRIWYYVSLVDSNGNFDREPEISSGYYTYDQNPLDPCADTPDPPDRLAGSPSGETSVFLNWSAPALNTDGSNIVDSISYDVYRSDAGLSGTFNNVTSGISDLSYTDSSFTNLTSNVYVWKVMAKDSCGTPNESGYSSPWLECVGGGGIAVTAGKSSILANDTDGFTLTATVCSLAGNSTSDTITVHMDAAVGSDEDTITMVETGVSTGIFGIDDSLANHGSVITTSDSGTCSPANTCLYIDPGGDTIIFDWVNDGTTTYSDTYATVTVTGDVCGKTPSNPTGLTITSQANAEVGLSWTAADTGAYNNVGLSVYRVYHNVGGSGWVSIGDVTVGTNAVDVNYSGTTATLNGSSSGTHVKNNVIQYKLRSVNSCPNEGADSLDIVEETKT